MRITNTPRNLLHCFKRKSIMAYELNEYLTKNPTAKRRIGSLPFEWIKDIAPSERSNVTQQVCDVFENFALNNRNISDNSSGYGRKLQVPDSIFEELQNALRKILKRDDINISLAGEGALKICSKIKVGDKAYAFSIFKGRGCRIGLESYYAKGHGRGYEPQNIFNFYKRGAHGRFARPFLSRICDEKDGAQAFTLTKFIEKESKIKSQKDTFALTREYVLHGDEHNEINNIFIEAGGMIKNEDYLQNRHERATWYRFANIIDGYYTELINDMYKKETSNIIQEFLMKEILKGKDINSDNYNANIKKSLVNSGTLSKIMIYDTSASQKRFLFLLKTVGYDTPIYRFLMKKVGAKMKPTKQDGNFQNFAEEINNTLKYSNRKVCKQLRTIKKLRALKKELELKGEWENFKAILHKDFVNVYIDAFHSPRANRKFEYIIENDPYLIRKELDLNLENEDYFKKIYELHNGKHLRKLANIFGNSKKNY